MKKRMLITLLVMLPLVAAAGSIFVLAPVTNVGESSMEVTNYFSAACGPTNLPLVAMCVPTTNDLLIKAFVVVDSAETNRFVVQFSGVVTTTGYVLAARVPTWD